MTQVGTLQPLEMLKTSVLAGWLEMIWLVFANYHYNYFLHEFSVRALFSKNKNRLPNTTLIHGSLLSKLVIDPIYWVTKNHEIQVYLADS